MSFLLPLSPFETYTLMEDRPERPMVFLMRLRLSGTVERDALHSAWEAALERHPLLTARIHDTGQGWREWVPITDRRPPLEWACPTDALQPWLDLTREPGVRGRVCPTADGVELLVLFHHACCDGIGALQFLEDWLLLYHNERSEKAARIPLRQIEPELLPQRGSLPRGPRSKTTLVARYAKAIAVAVNFLVRRPLPVAVPPHDSGAEVNSTLPGLCEFRFDADETRQLRDRARQCGGTLNDLLLWALFLTLNGWNDRWGGGLERGVLRLAMPMNLRSDELRRVPAANVVAITFLEFSPTACRNPTAFFQTLRRETEGLKRRRFGTFLRAMKAVNRSSWLRRIIPMDRRYATTVLSNLGAVFANRHLPRQDELFAPGGLVLDNLAITMPLRGGMPVAFAAFYSAGSLHLGLSYDRRQFAPERAEELLHGFVTRLHESAVASIPAPIFKESRQPAGPAPSLQH